MRRQFNIPIILLLLCTGLLPSCKKYIQQKEQQAAMAIITDGVWYVEQYLQNDSDITASFSGYQFKFDGNGVVTGTRDSLSLSGVWSASIATRSIYSNFPGASAPLKNLNETWTIKDSSPTYVAATSTDSVTKANNVLHLQKQ